jgi:hypothetical protein
MTLPLLYANNADVKYPLDAFHETAIPNDVLLDLCLNIGPEYTPIVTAVRISPYLAFVAIEDETTGAPLAVAAVDRAQMAVVYPLTLSVAGSGWLVFGPGISREFYSGPVAVPLDPETVVQLQTVAPLFSLRLNRADYPLANVLSLLLANEVLTATVQGNTVYLDRNDDILEDAQIADLTETPGDEPDLNKYVYSIGGVSPDIDGNIDIDVEGCLDNCEDVWSLSIPRSDLGIGEYGELPLDTYAANDFQPSTPCFSSLAGDSDSSEDGFDGCQRIVKIDIEDNDREIGTLYTVSG